MVRRFSKRVMSPERWERYIRSMRNIAKERIEEKQGLIKSERGELDEIISMLGTEEELTPLELEKYTKKINRSIKTLRKELTAAIEIAETWRDEITKLSEEAEEILEVKIIKSEFVEYICLRWYTNRTYSGPVLIIAMQALRDSNIAWTALAEDDIVKQIRELIIKHAEEIIREIVKIDNQNNGTLSMDGIESVWTSSVPEDNSANFTVKLSDIVGEKEAEVNNDELAKEHNFIREDDSYVYSP